MPKLIWSMVFVCMRMLNKNTAIGLDLDQTMIEIMLYQRGYSPTKTNALISMRQVLFLKYL